MTGLEKIIEDIEQESEQTVSITLKKAKEETVQIMEEARKESKDICDQIAKENEHRISDLNSHTDYAASLHQRQKVLSAKQEIIGKVFEEALQKAESMSDDSYFELLLQMAIHNAHQGDGEILLNEKDYKRLPSNFIEKLAGKLPTGSKLTISTEKADIGSGFILKYGDIEENCSLKEILAAKHDMLLDKVRAILF